MRMRTICRIALCLLAIVMACQAPAKSRVEKCSMTSRILGVDKNYVVYLPDGYDEGDNYPVLYLMHGSGGDCETWTKSHDARTIADWRISSGFASPMVIVMPDASGEGPGNRGKHLGYFNYDDWRYEDFFFQEFIPFIESAYKVRHDRGGRAISGMSMGGGATVIYAMHHPEVFGSAYAMAARVEGTPTPKKNLTQEYLDKIVEHNMVEYLRNASADVQKAIGDVRWLIDCGDSDYMFEGDAHLYLLMRELGFRKAQFRVSEGAHKSIYWRMALPEALTYVSIGFAEPVK